MSPNTCPSCGGPLAPAFEVDNGVGIQTGGPWGCDTCHYVEPDPLERLGLRTLVCKEMQEGDARIIKASGVLTAEMFDPDAGLPRKEGK
jgi:hypothetical protein